MYSRFQIRSAADAGYSVLLLSWPKPLIVAQMDPSDLSPASPTHIAAFLVSSAQAEPLLEAAVAGERVLVDMYPPPRAFYNFLNKSSTLVYVPSDAM